MAKRIVIAGAGFSGTMVAVHLLHSQKNLDVTLLEASERPQRGAAYGTTCSEHLLNVRAEGMSAFPDDPSHFYRWAQGRLGIDLSPEVFLPRMLFGEYLEEIFREACALGRKRGRVAFQQKQGNLENVDLAGDQLQLYLEGGERLVADRLVLALGNFPPSHRCIPNKDFLSSPYYLGNPWGGNKVAEIPTKDPVSIIGTGLTTLDMLLSLRSQGHQGPIMVFSRHGRFPRVHGQKVSWEDFIKKDRNLSPLELLQRFRSELAKGGPWRGVVDSIRPHNQAIWKNFSLAQKRQFLRHLRPYWEVHRHRMAPQVAQCVEELKASGQLDVQRARLKDICEKGEGVVLTLQDKKLGRIIDYPTKWVLNCTGPESDFSHMEHPLLKSLQVKGYLSPDPFHLGFAASDDGALLGSRNRIFTLGPPMRGILYETVAIPEIRGQAAELAAAIQN